MDDDARPVAAVVLPAGRATRFGTTKQLAEVAGRPLVRHAVDTARRAGLAPVVVVVGHDADAVRGVLPDDVEVVDNPAHAEGQVDLPARGRRRRGRDQRPRPGALLADQPGVDSDVVAQVVEAHRAGHPVVRARYRDRPGHPVLFDRTTWPALARVTGDHGARELLASLHVHEVPVDTPCPPDVDRPEDLPG